MGVVLVVEDDPVMSCLVQAVLGKEGHRVLTASDGQGALDGVRCWMPDLLVLDVSLVGTLTGLDVCRAVRADPATAATAVLVLSGWAFDSDIEAGRAAGADGYLAKPFTNSELLSRVQELIDRAVTRKAASGNSPGRG